MSSLESELVSTGDEGIRSDFIDPNALVFLASYQRPNRNHCRFGLMRVAIHFAAVPI